MACFKEMMLSELEMGMDSARRPAMAAAGEHPGAGGSEIRSGPIASEMAGIYRETESARIAKEPRRDCGATDGPGIGRASV